MPSFPRICIFRPYRLYSHFGRRWYAEGEWLILADINNMFTDHASIRIYDETSLEPEEPVDLYWRYSIKVKARQIHVRYSQVQSFSNANA